MPRANSSVAYKNIPGFDGYRVGDDGSIWSCWESEPIIVPGESGLRGRRYKIGTTWRPLVGSPHKGGYRMLVHRGRGVCVHRVVLEAFVGPAPEGMEACHNDGDPANNALSNLRWDTHAANNDDRFRHGTVPQGEHCGSSKLTEEAVKSIRAEYATGNTSCKKLGQKYGASQSTIHNIVRRSTWKHI